MARNFLGVPIRYQDVQAGYFYLLDNEADREFSAEDEEIMALFTSRAGATLANARKHHDEQQARVGLEALITGFSYRREYLRLSIPKSRTVPQMESL